MYTIECPTCEQDAEVEAVSIDPREELRITEYACPACDSYGTIEEPAERWELERDYEHDRMWG